MSLFQELKNKYPNQQLNLYGDCLIIPRNDWQKEWEPKLRLEGHACRVTEVDYVTVWAVSVKQEVGYAKTTLPEPQKPEPKQEETPNLKVPWSQEEKNTIKQLYESNLSINEVCQEIHKRYPKRSAVAAKGQISYLLQKGTLKYRVAKLAAKPQQPAETKPQPEPQPTKQQPQNEEGVVFQSIMQIFHNIDERLTNIEHTTAQLKAEFQNHEHSPHTGKPTVPPT